MAQNYTWPSVSVTATNPSVSLTGGSVPGSATLVGAENPSHNLEPLMVDSSGNLLVSLAADPASPLSVNLTEVAGSAISLGQKVSASSLPVVIASDDTVAISAASLPLPTGAATSALQTTGNTSLSSIVTNTGDISAQLPASLGQKASAASLAVVIASDQSTLPVSASSLPLPTGAATAANQTNGSQQTQLIGSGNLASVTAANALKVDGSAVTQPISGTVTANQGTSPWVNNLTQVGGSAISLGQKVSASSLPVVLASDQSSLAVTESGRSSANAPVYNDYTSTNITTSAYVQLIASTTSATNFVDIFDSSGQAMILAVGAMGSEIIQGYVSPGGEQIPLHIPAGSRVAYKALTANATAGYLIMSLYD